MIWEWRYVMGKALVAGSADTSAFMARTPSPYVALILDWKPRPTTRAERKVQAVEAVLSANGCDCDCDHDSESHEDTCTRCVACRVQLALNEVDDAP